MIHGRVSNLEALVSVNFRLPPDSDLQIGCVVDTGFAGALTLPPAAVAGMGLPYLTEITANLANNTDVRTDVHLARIVWDSAECEVAVLALGERPLLGTELLRGRRFAADFEEDGPVVIEALRAGTVG